jgi:hypothetical protein
MPPVEFEPKIPVLERAKSFRASDRTANVTSADKPNLQTS